MLNKNASGQQSLRCQVFQERKMSKSNKRGMAILVVAATLFVLLTWGATWYFDFCHGEKTSQAMEYRGVVGDTFGAVNALFTGLAIIAVVVDICYQRQQVADQRQEKSDRDTSDHLEAVERRFFQLLGSWQAAVGSLRTTYPLSPINTEHYEGREVLARLKDDLIQKLNRAPPIAVGNRVLVGERYESFYNEECDLLGHYFRLLYHLLKFIAESGIPPQEQIFYTRIIRAHLSNSELVLIFYNGISKHGVEKLFPLVDKYDLLQNINREKLRSPEDVKFYQSLSNQSRNVRYFCKVKMSGSRGGGFAPGMAGRWTPHLL
jgi:uncharacterized membrane protein